MIEQKANNSECLDPRLIQREGIYIAPQTSIYEACPSIDKTKHIPFYKSPLDLYYAVDESGQHEYLGVIKYPVVQKDLLRLLGIISPSPSLFREAIVEDWEDTDQNLQKAHAHALGESWNLFLQHLPVFLKTLQHEDLLDIYTSASVEQYIIDDSSVQWGRIYEVAAENTENHISAARFKLFLENKYGISEEIIEKNRRLTPSSFYPLVNNLIYLPNWIERQTKTDLREFMSLLSESEKVDFYSTFSPYGWNREIFIDSDGEIISTYDATIAFENEKGVANITVTDFGKGNYKLNDRYRYMFWRKESEHSYRNVNALYPVLHWYKDSNGNTSIDVTSFSRLSPTIRGILASYVTTLMSEKGVRFSANRMNTLVGLLSAIYYLPHLRNDSAIWPKGKPFHRGGKNQAMGEAQVPVLAIMQKDIFSQENPLLTGLEEYIQSSIQQS